ncbi:MAG TPA: hypothetical protein VFP55_11890, partial [Solirubrobacteraceae bacterium]|nr:hypothetical protein [Solirubrobacteraceae bacterium]
GYAALDDYLRTGLRHQPGHSPRRQGQQAVLWLGRAAQLARRVSATRGLAPALALLARRIAATEGRLSPNEAHAITTESDLVRIALQHRGF